MLVDSQQHVSLHVNSDAGGSGCSLAFMYEDKLLDSKHSQKVDFRHIRMKKKWSLSLPSAHSQVDCLLLYTKAKT